MNNGGSVNHGAASSHGIAAVVIVRGRARSTIARHACQQSCATNKRSAKGRRASRVRMRTLRAPERTAAAMPPGLGHIWGIVATVVLLLFIIYRRVRRLFGRQPLKPARMLTRIVILCVVGALLSPAALRSSAAALALSAGLALGVAIGAWGARHTRFEWHEGELHYVPHTDAGPVVSALFLGRLLYRFLLLSQSDSSLDAGASARQP